MDSNADSSSRRILRDRGGLLARHSLLAGRLAVGGGIGSGHASIVADRPRPCTYVRGRGRSVFLALASVMRPWPVHLSPSLIGGGPSA